MLKIETVDGDLLEQKVDVIAHQVNCLGVMGDNIGRLADCSRCNYSES
jgi:O-acetyl-ADP-ribose deacetylase (regulator of RNase III)